MTTKPSAEPFAIRIPRIQLTDLRRRLASTRWPDQLPHSEWLLGTDVEYLRSLATYWRTGFDWRRQEAELNAMPQYTARVEGQTIHFIWWRSGSPTAAPLLVTHGWPSTCFESRRLLPLLADPARHGASADDAFDIVVPSVPGYGFSSRPTEPLESRGVARLLHALMTEVLGYEHYFAHGGDIGAGITTALAHQYPRHVRGIHLLSVRDPFIGDGSRALSVAESAYVEARERWSDEEGGYSHLQRTRPQTLAYALNDSPAGLLAWTVEKFRAWSDCNGDVERRFSRDDLLVNATIYWATGTIGSSMRYYWASRSTPWVLRATDRVDVPTAVAIFPKDLTRPPKEWAERTYNIIRWNQMTRGGHFAAHEEPELLADDLRTAFRSLRS